MADRGIGSCLVRSRLLSTAVGCAAGGARVLGAGLSGVARARCARCSRLAVSKVCSDRSPWAGCTPWPSPPDSATTGEALSSRGRQSPLLLCIGGLTSRGRNGSGRTALGAGLVLGDGTCVTALLRLTAPSSPSRPSRRVLLLSIVVASVLVASVGSSRLVDGSRLDLGIGSVSAFEAAIGAALGRDAITVRFPAANGRWIDPAGDFVGLEVDRMEIIREDADGNELLAAVSVTRAHVDRGCSGRPARPPSPCRSPGTAAGRGPLSAGRSCRSRVAGCSTLATPSVDSSSANFETERSPASPRSKRSSMAPTGSNRCGTESQRRGRSSMVSPVGSIRSLARSSNCARSDCEQKRARRHRRRTADIELPAHIARAVWYTCSEAIANAAKHAPDSSVSITLERRQSRDLLDVEDDGPGGADPMAGDCGVLPIARQRSAVRSVSTPATREHGSRCCVPLPGEG